MKWENLYSIENYEHYKKVAEDIFKSRTVQKPWLVNPEAVHYVMQLGVDMGISPLIALDKLRRLDVKGRPGGWMIEINLARSLVAKKGGTFHVVKESDNAITTLMKRTEEGDVLEHTETVTLDQLKRAGTASKDSFRYHPKQIYRAAAFRQSCAVLFPDILLGTTVLDFEVEDGEPLSFTDDNGEEISADTVKPEDHKPKGSNKPAARKRRTKKRIQLEKDASAQKPVGMSLVETTEDETFLKEAGYRYEEPAQTWVYGKPNPAKEDHPLAAPQREEEPPPPEVEDFTQPAQDFDLNTEQAPKAEPFNPENPDHHKLLVKAASEFTWTPEVDKQVKSTFMAWIEGKGLVASVDSLKSGLEQCASQYLN